VSWQDFAFQTGFAEPPVVVVLPSMGMAGETIPASVRIRSVSVSSFQALVVVPPGPTSNRSDMKVAYMAMLPGVHQLPDGTQMEAGHLTTMARQTGEACKATGLTTLWDQIDFQATFSSTPAVVTALQSANNEQGAVPSFFSTPWLTVACQDPSSTHISVALESAETSQVGSMSLPEDVGYVAMEVGHGFFSTASGDVTYDAVLSGEVVMGFDDGATTVSLSTDLMTIEPLVLGSQISRKGNNGGWLRVSALSSSSVEIFIDEDMYCDTERAHIAESASILSWSSGFGLAATTSTTTTTTTTAFSGIADMEISNVTLQSGMWTSLSFTYPFAAVPVVVITPSAEGAEPASIRIKDVTTTGFLAVVAKPIGSSVMHAAMTATFVAVVPGRRQLPGSATWLEAGRTSTSHIIAGSCTPAGLQTSWQKVAFQNPFSNPPAFLTTIQTANNEVGLPAGNSQPWFTVGVNSVNADDAWVSLEMAETSEHGGLNISQDEVVGWIAITRGTDSLQGATGPSVQFASVYSAKDVSGWDNGPARVPLGGNVGGNPLVVASQSTRYGGDGGWVRLWSASPTSVEVVVDEDTSCDSERGHANKEEVSILAFSGPCIH